MGYNDTSNFTYKGGILESNGFIVGVAIGILILLTSYLLGFTFHVIYQLIDRRKNPIISQDRKSVLLKNNGNPVVLSTPDNRKITILVYKGLLMASALLEDYTKPANHCDIWFGQFTIHCVRENDYFRITWDGNLQICT